MSERIERALCFCGKIQAEAQGEPFWICSDHDDDCRRAIGSPINVWIGYRPEQVSFKSGQPKALFAYARRHQDILRRLRDLYRVYRCRAWQMSCT